MGCKKVLTTTALVLAIFVPLHHGFVMRPETTIGVKAPVGQFRPARTTTVRTSSQRFSSTLLSPEEVSQQPSVTSNNTNFKSQEQSESNANSKKSWVDDGFVFGLEGSGLERPKGKVAITVIEGDTLETKPYQIAMVSGTFLAHAGFLTVSYMHMLEINGGNVVWTSAQAILLTLASWVLADFGSGVLHWSVDNYGNGRTPIMGSIIAAFQGHHTAPWTITERGFCNNVYKLCIPFGIIPMVLISMISGPFSTFFWTTFCVFEILSQEFHKWSHMLPSESPAWVNWLQQGLTVSRKVHGLHHLAPYEGNYAIISGITNNVLDRTGFFRRLEHVIYQLNGVEPNAWKLDPLLRERTLKGDYRWIVGPSKKTLVTE